MKRKLEQLILRSLIKVGERNNQILRKNAENAMEVNQKLLFNLIENNKNTEYGVKYKFADIKSIEDYKRMVPLTTYEDYREYVRRMIKNKEKNLLTSKEIVHYNLSSGTTKKKKLIPYTKEAINIYNKYASFSNILSRLHPKDKPDNLKNPIFAGISSNLSYFDNGISYGGLSEKILKQHENVATFFSVLPKEILFPKENVDITYFQARYALVERDISYFYTSFCTQLLGLMRYIEANYEMLIEDINNGTINPSVNVTESMKNDLYKKTYPDPIRAKELEHIFKGGFKGIAKRLWPSFTSIDAISNGGFKIYRKELNYYLGDDIKINMFGYAASEGIFSVCQGVEEENSLLVPDSCFFEFMPLGETDPTKTKNLDEINEGEEYELIITNLSGFYRYKMNDIIKVDTKFKNCPTIHFERRKSQWINTMGEKLEEKSINKAIENMKNRLSKDVIDYVVYVDREKGLVHYDFFIEFSDKTWLREEDVQRILQEELEKECAVLKIFRERKMMGLCRTYFLQDKSFAEYRKNKDMETNNQFKQLHIISDDNAILFFRNKSASICA